MPFFWPSLSASGTTTASVSSRLDHLLFSTPIALCALELIVPPAELKKVLKPDVFQEFPLQEKTIISHNVAM